MLRDVSPFQTIADDLQNAAFDPSAWPAALEKVSQYVGGSGALMFSMDQRFKMAPCSRDLDEMTDDYFSNQWFEQDLRYLGIPTLESKGLITDPDCFSEADLVTSDFYRDFLDKYQRKWFAGVGFRAGGDLWCLSLQRSSEQGMFQTGEFEKLKTLWRPFSDAATLSRTLGQTWLDGMARTFEVLGQAALLCDHTGLILQISEPAVGQLKPYLKGNRLSFPAGPAADAFAATIRSALNPSAKASTCPLACQLRLHHKTLVLRAIPLRGYSRLVFSKASLLLLVSQENSAADVELKSAYRLTDAETRVALALASGTDIREMSDAFRTKPDTIRSQLKAVYAKTGTKRQAQLVALISALRGRHIERP